MRILAISGGGLSEAESYLRIAKRLGADDALAKPIGSEDLLKTIGKLLGQSPVIDK